MSRFVRLRFRTTSHTERHLRQERRDTRAVSQSQPSPYSKSIEEHT